MEDTQGKCQTCKVRVLWKGRPLLRDALCSRCKQPLWRTTRELRNWPVVREHPLEVVR